MTQITKRKAKQRVNCKNSCEYHCARLSYTAHNSLIIFPLNLQTNFIALTQSTGGEESLERYICAHIPSMATEKILLYYRNCQQ